MHIWQILLLVIWLAVGVILAVLYDRDMGKKDGCLAYKLTGDVGLRMFGRLFTALHWPILLPIAVAAVAQQIISQKLSRRA